jgi:hypothetical protein
MAPAHRFSLPLVAALACAALFPPSAAADGGFDWPVTGPVIRGFVAPDSPFGAGHRGIDIAVPLGTEVLAPAPGVVAFAGWVAGSLFVSIDHEGGVRTTYSWLSAILVAGGEPVQRGAVIALTGHGHADVQIPHLHFGVRIGGQYVDPLLLLEPGSVVGLIRLAPLVGPEPGPSLFVALAAPAAGVRELSRPADSVWFARWLRDRIASAPARAPPATTRYREAFGVGRSLRLGADARARPRGRVREPGSPSDRLCPAPTMGAPRHAPRRMSRPDQRAPGKPRPCTAAPD